MQKSVYVVLVAALTLQGIGCSTSSARLNYRSAAEESQVSVSEGSVSGESLGVAKGDAGGAIWADCTEKAQDSLKELLAQAKNSGANAVGDIKWYASGNSQPSCKKGWGYLIVWPLVLTPLFMSTAVEAHMYKVGGGRRAGLIMIPEKLEDQQKLVQALVR